MLLRRFSERFAKQDWTAIVIEFAIVVAGVFVGTQVSNWNSARIEQQRGRDYLRRIEVNLLDDQQSMDRTLDYWGRAIGFGAAAVGYADSGALAGGSRWRTVVAFYQAGQLLPFDFDSTTYQELVSAGDLGLIRSDVLRSAFASYYVTGPVTTSPHLMRLSPEYRVLVRSYTPMAVSDYIWKNCVVNPGENTETISDDCASPISEAAAQSVLDGYLAVPGLVPALRFWLTNEKVASNLLRGSRRDAVALLAKVQAELAR